MQLHRRLQLLILLLSSLAAAAHNITLLLEGNHNFTTFNRYLSLTHLAEDINARTTITVLAVDNVAMADFFSSAHNPSIGTLKNILSLHVLLDYFGARKLHDLADGSALAATLFQASGYAPGSTGVVNITDLQGGKVAFSPKDNCGVLDVYFVKSLKEIPYNISVIQISKILPSVEAEAPTVDPGWMNLTTLMSDHGCKEFADTLSASSEAFSTYKDNVEGGLTVFCPSDGPFQAFRPRFNNLTAADKVSLLEFYGIPIYMSMTMLRSDNGPVNTLATDGSKKFGFTVQNDGQVVTLKTEINIVRISGTIIDQQPLAIYVTDDVLLPWELFNSEASPAPSPSPTLAPAPALAPGPGKAANAPKAAKQLSPPSPLSPADSPAYLPDGDEADQTDDNGADGLAIGSGGLGVVALASILGALSLTL
ncbi:hypothetical protein SAY86_016154 [Trapa natans]|uniref:FAS1 domain-containing protein n=1 Tax=Trapa natans TaxID=22666 RepID=A0AAN7L905_TRANT|nr:hypothetical protein SAY86_016154 [Trapa natans]